MKYQNTIQLKRPQESGLLITYHVQVVYRRAMTKRVVLEVKTSAVSEVIRYTRVPCSYQHLGAEGLRKGNRAPTTLPQVI